MEVMEDDGEMVFLFHLKDGYASCSHALQVARAAGIDEEILKRGAEVTSIRLLKEYIWFVPHLLIVHALHRIPLLYMVTK